MFLYLHVFLMLSLCLSFSVCWFVFFSSVSLFLLVCFLMTERQKCVDLDGGGSGEDLGAVREGKS